MSTSGSIDYSVSARDVIVFALNKIGVVKAGMDPSDAQVARAFTELNFMLKGWQKYENLWRLTEGSVTLVAATYSYALSPVPHRVVSARYRDASSPALDMPMSPLSRDEYYDLPNKAVPGTPTEFYVDYQRATATMLLWKAPATVTTETIRYTYQRKFEDIDALSNELDVRQEWLEVVGYNLAARLPNIGGDPGLVMEAKERGEILKEEMLDDDREDVIQFVPERRYG